MSEERLSKALEQYEKTKQEHLEELKTLVRIPSVSFDGFDPAVVVRSAGAVADLLKRSGLENVEILQLKNKTDPENKPVHPYVYADWSHAPGKPTVLLYAHHDVQPPGREHLWKSQPFEPTCRNGRLYGRGTADDKAGIVVHTAAISSFLKSTGGLPLNVKLIIEGEEEVGSSHLPEFLKLHARKLKADAMILTDTQNYDVGVPALTTSLRGLITFDIELSALSSPKHSGMWGGPTPDVGMAMSKLLATLVDPLGRVAIPGIWDEVRAVTKAEETEYASLPFELSEFRAQAGLLADTWVLPAKDGTIKPLISMWREPSITINAIELSTREQASNAIMDCAWARFGIRLVPDMNPIACAELISAHLKRHCPWGIDLQLKPDIGGGAWGTTVDFSLAEHKAFKAAFEALEKGYGVRPVFMGCGGSIPFVGPLADALGGVPALLIGVEDPYTNAHSENESMVIADFESCIRSAIYFYDLFARPHI